MSYDRDWDITFEQIEERARESGASVCDAQGRPVLIELPIQIRCAINSSSHRRLCYEEICEVLATRYPGYMVGDQNWRMNIRHTLSSRMDLVNVHRPPGYKGHGNWWVIKPLPEGAPLRKQKPSKTGKRGSFKAGTKKGPSSPSPNSSVPAEATRHDDADVSPAPGRRDGHHQAALSLAGLLAGDPSQLSMQSPTSPHCAAPASPWTAPMLAHGAGWQPSSPSLALESWGSESRSRSGSSSSSSLSSEHHPRPIASQTAPYWTPPATYWAEPMPPNDPGRYVPTPADAVEAWATRSRSGSGSSATSSTQSYQHESFHPSPQQLLAGQHKPRMLPAFAAPPPHPYRYQMPAPMTMPHHVRRVTTEAPAPSVMPPNPSPPASSSPSRRGVMRISDLLD